MLTVAVLPPLLVLFLHEAFVRQRWPVWGTGIGLGALVAFQLSTFLELVAAGAIAAVLLLIALAIAYRHTLRERMRYFFTTLGIAFGSFVVLGGFQLWTVVFGSRNLTQLRSNVHPPNVYVADLLEFVVPTRYNASVSAFRSIASEFTSNGAEANAFIGLPLLIVVGIIVLHHRRARTVRIAAALTAVMALLSLGPRLHIAGNSPSCCRGTSSRSCRCSVTCFRRACRSSPTSASPCCSRTASVTYRARRARDRARSR